MTEAAAQLLATFESLSGDDRSLIADRIVRYTAEEADCPPLADEDLTAAAEELFLAMDREEAGTDGTTG